PLLAGGERASLACAGTLAGLAVSSRDGRLSAGDPSFVAYHGLHWLSANLAAAQPLALVVDDVHWVDEPSLRWLEFTIRRLEGASVAVLLASRSSSRVRGGPLA